jgi:hypothetical protein
MGAFFLKWDARARIRPERGIVGGLGTSPPYQGGEGCEGSASVQEMLPPLIAEEVLPS